MPPSLSPAARRAASGENATERKYLPGFGGTSQRLLPSAAPQRRSPPLAAVARSVPSAASATATDPLSWTRIVRSSSPDGVRQRRAVPSESPAASLLPSRDRLSEATSPPATSLR